MRDDQQPPDPAQGLIESIETLAAAPLPQLNLDPLAGFKEDLWQLVRTHVWFFSNRVALGCLALHYAKAGLRRLFRRRGKRARKTVHLVNNVMLPNSFFGPVIGITIGVMELTGKLPSLSLANALHKLKQLKQRATASALTPESLPAAATALTGKALTAGIDALIQSTPLVGPAPLADILPTENVPAIPAEHPMASVGALMGLPVTHAAAQ